MTERTDKTNSILPISTRTGKMCREMFCYKEKGTFNVLNREENDGATIPVASWIHPVNNFGNNENCCSLLFVQW